MKTFKNSNSNEPNNATGSQTNSEASENILATMPVKQLLIKMSVPMMISYFIQAMYNIVDSMFIARISENALTAVSLAYPMQQLITAIAVGLGVGLNACVPRFLGLNDREKAEKTIGTAIFLDICLIIFFMLLGFTATKAYYSLQTDITDIVELGSSYLSICWIFCQGCFLAQIFEKMLVCSGFPTLAMLAQASGAIFNLIFDPLLIFGIGPFPELGIAGAATATVGGQILAAIVALALNLKLNTSINIRPSFIRLYTGIAKDILSVGIPSMITMGLVSLTTFCVNQILLVYSTTATAVYGIWIKLQNFCYMPIFGMNNGIVPILSFNYSQNMKDRVTDTVRLGVTFAATYLIILALLIECFPSVVLAMFSASDNMLSIGIPALRLCVCSLPLGGLCIMLTSCMQAMLHSRYALAVNIMRQFVIIVGAFAIISALTKTVGMLWIAVPITEVTSFIIAITLYRRMTNRLWMQT